MLTCRDGKGSELSNQASKMLYKLPGAVNIYGLLTKSEVKMAGYWPSSFFASLWTETEPRSINSQKKNEANIQPSWPNKLGQ